MANEVPKCITHPERDATCQGGFYLNHCAECHSEAMDRMHREAEPEESIPFEDREPNYPSWVQDN